MTFLHEVLNVLKTRVHARKRSHLEELERFTTEEWPRIPQQMCFTLVKNTDWRLLSTKKDNWPILSTCQVNKPVMAEGYSQCDLVRMKKVNRTSVCLQEHSTTHFLENMTKIKACKSKTKDMSKNQYQCTLYFSCIFPWCLWKSSAIFIFYNIR